MSKGPETGAELLFWLLMTSLLQHYETQGLIATGRGSVMIEDRDGLEEAANGFYGAPEAEYERLFPPAREGAR